MADGAIGFMILVGILVIMFAHGQAKIDRIRADSRKRIADGWADFERRMDAFVVANPKASCANCDYQKGGSCTLEIRRPRHFCLRWRANDDHREAIRMAAMTDEQVVAEIGRYPAHDLARAIKEIEQHIATPSCDPDLREQGRRILRIARPQQEAQRG